MVRVRPDLLALRLFPRTIGLKGLSLIVRKNSCRTRSPTSFQMPIRARFQYMFIFPILNISEPGLIHSVKGGFAYIKFLRIRPSNCSGKGSKNKWDNWGLLRTKPVGFKSYVRVKYQLKSFAPKLDDFLGNPNELRFKKIICKNSVSGINKPIQTDTFLKNWLVITPE